MGKFFSNRESTPIYRNGEWLFAEALGVDILWGVEDDEHGTAADLAVVIVFGGHFGIRRDGDFEGLEAGGAGDWGGGHGRK